METDMMNHTKLTPRLRHFADALSAAANIDRNRAVLINKRSGDALVARGIAREVRDGYVATHEFMLASVPGYSGTDEAERGSIRAEFHEQGYCDGQHGDRITEDDMTSCEWDIARENDEVRDLDLARVNAAPSWTEFGSNWAGLKVAIEAAGYTAELEHTGGNVYVLYVSSTVEGQHFRVGVSDFGVSREQAPDGMTYDESYREVSEDATCGEVVKMVAEVFEDETLHVDCPYCGDPQSVKPEVCKACAAQYFTPGTRVTLDVEKFPKCAGIVFEVVAVTTWPLDRDTTPYRIANLHTLGQHANHGRNARLVDLRIEDAR